MLHIQNVFAAETDSYYLRNSEEGEPHWAVKDSRVVRTDLKLLMLAGNIDTGGRV